MAMTPQQRDEKRREKAARLQEEDLRLKVRPGTKRALLDLMEWAGIEEQGEAMTLMIHHLHALGRDGAKAFLEPPHHEIALSKNVALAFERESLKMVRKDGGDEIISPKLLPHGERECLAAQIGILEQA